RSKGKSHPAAMRSLAFKWIRILFRCWKNREAYDEAKYLASLKRKGSPIAKLLAL
ncbi:MAG: IS110 family transposase, partial [Cyanobacteria bacterium J06638_22]